MSESARLVNKLWDYCDLLRDDGLSYSDYVEQLTFLLYLKMSHERTQPPYNQKSIIPEKYDWSSLISRDGTDLDTHYRELLSELGKKEGMMGLIFRKGQNKIQDPSKLRRLIVNLIGKENWLTIDADIKGDAYEGLLEKNAQDSKSGAGQYFTPRSVIDCICTVMNPLPGEIISDPACGTGGFLLAAHDYITRSNPKMDRDQKIHLRRHALNGVELVDSVSRLCAMNLSLHGIGDENFVPIETSDSLQSHPGTHYDVVLSNPPFGKKSSVKIVNAEGNITKDSLIIERDDFWATTTNKQLMFLQHIYSILRVNGRAAVVLPDNVLTDDGAGEIVRRKLLDVCDLHTILRLPTGLFYAPGVKANVLFFDKKEGAADSQTKGVWFYDLRTNLKFSPKKNPLKHEDMAGFISLYSRENMSKREQTWSLENPEGRWRFYPLEEILESKTAKLDKSWIQNKKLIDIDSIPTPEIIISDIMDNLDGCKELAGALKPQLNGTES